MEIKYIKNYRINIKFLVLIILTFNLQTKADSPITSTNISKAYLDNEMVVYAKNRKKMNKKIAKILHSVEIKIDIKAAIINAIGWKFEGTNNCENYCKSIFNKSSSELDLEELTEDDLFCIGYLKVLDDYFHPEKALPYLEKAKNLNEKSFTISIILALSQAQKMMNDDNNWCKMWEIVYKVFNDKSIWGDMKDEAKKIIWDYMILYKC